MNRYAHDPDAFTQGLVTFQGRTFESTGRYGESSLREIDLASGRVIRHHPLSPNLFGEGIALHQGILYQLTWESGLVIRYNPDSFEELGRARWPAEAWGLTSDGTYLILSDGSAVLRFLNPLTFREVRSVTVHQGRQPLRGLNELQFVDGTLFANIFPTSMAVLIDPVSGAVTGTLDLAPLAAEIPGRSRDSVPNGIAVSPDSGRLLVTGKDWPWIYEVELVPEKPKK